jgi:hypothetical protein
VGGEAARHPAVVAALGAALASPPAEQRPGEVVPGGEQVVEGCREEFVGDRRGGLRCAETTRRISSLAKDAVAPADRSAAASSAAGESARPSP